MLPLDFRADWKSKNICFLTIEYLRGGWFCVRAVARLKHNSSEEIAKARAEMHELTAKARSAELLAAYK